MNTKTSEFHITDNMPKVRMEAILEVEGPCPLCKSNNTLYVTNYRGEWQKVFQNSYLCKDCGTKWMGNSFETATFRALNASENRKMSKIPSVLTSLIRG